MSFLNALHTLPDGVCIDVDVNAGAKFFQIQSYNQWRKRIEVRVSSVPQKGLANKELMVEFSTLFNVPVQKVSICSGSTASKKSIKIDDISIDKVLRIVEDRLHDG